MQIYFRVLEQQLHLLIQLKVSIELNQLKQKSKPKKMVTGIFPTILSTRS